MNSFTMDSTVQQHEEIESPKKIYQAIQDTSKQLEVSSSRCSKIEDLFSSDLLSKRNKIKQLCEKLIYEHSLSNYGSFAREKLWKYVFYDAVTRARKMQMKEKSWSTLQLAYVKSHLLNGIGVLRLLILKIQEHPDFLENPILCRPDSLDGILNEDMLLIQKSRGTFERKDNKWMQELIYMCLINIGDLYRYLTDVYTKVSDDFDESSTYFSRAQECYAQAFLIYPACGLALNQLGNLHADRNWGIDATYYFLYSMLTEKFYEGAYPNLRQLLDKKLVQFARLPASVQPKPMEILCHGFMSMLYHLLCEESQLKNYEKFCQDTLSNFHERLVAYDPDLDEQLLFKFSSISVMAVRRLQMSNSINTPACVGFAMSVFFQLVYRIGNILDEVSHPDIIPPPSVVCIKENEELSLPAAEEFLNGSATETARSISPKECKPKRKPRVGMRRGPRRAGRGSSIPSLDSEDSEDDSDRELSSGEEFLQSCWRSSDDESDFDFSDSEEEEEISKKSHEKNKAFDSSSSNGQSDSFSGSRENSQKSSLEAEQLSQQLHDEERGTPYGKPVIEVNHEQKLVIDLEQLRKCQNQVEGLLVAMSPFIRCLQTCSEIKDAFAANAEKIFLEKLCNILTLIVSSHWGLLLEKSKLRMRINKEWKDLLNEDEHKSEELFCWELPEDRSMLGLPVLKSKLSSLVIEDELSADDKFLIRLGRLANFGKWMIETGSFSILYLEEEKKFVVSTQKMFMERMRFKRMKKLIDGKNDSESVLKMTQAYKEMRLKNGGRNRRDRGRRSNFGGARDSRPPRLRQDWSGLGPRIGEADAAPLLVVVDLSAALYKIENVRRIACNKNFIVYVPGSVYKTLDMLKDTEETGSDEARAAFRWIEQATRRNHPGVQILREEEKGIPMQQDDSIDLDTGSFFHMIDCCKFLIGDIIAREGRHHVQRVFGDYRDKQSIFYLTGNESLLDGTFKREFDPIKSARSVGVYVDNIKMYPPGRRRERRKWMTSGKSKG